MRLRMLAWGAVLGLFVALLTPLAALAQADTTTTHFSDTETFPGVMNPCSGVTGTVTTTFKGVTHLTELPDGSFHETTTVTDRFTFVPDDPSQPTITGKETFRAGANLNSQNNFTATVAAHQIAKGSDGSRITFHVVAHVTRHADGTVTVEFEKQRMSCP
jgi:hypothetical protein